MAVLKLCAARGCDELALPGLAHCDDHERDRQDREAKRRSEAKLSSTAREGHALYKSKWWTSARLAFLKRHPLCVECQSVGLVVPAEHVDHVVPHRGNLKLFRDRRNWQPLCRSCHSRKTAREVWHGDRHRGVSKNQGG